MKHLLALDIGITTGYAVYSVGAHGIPPKLKEIGDIQEENFEQTVKYLRDKYTVSYSVAERPVIMRGDLGNRLARLIAITDHELSHQIRFIDPSRWKSSPARKAPTPRGTSQHVKDAIRIGVWYLGQL